MYRIRYGSMAWTPLPSCDHRMILAQAKWCLKSYALGLTLPSRFNPAETHIFLNWLILRLLNRYFPLHPGRNILFPESMLKQLYHTGQDS